MHLISAILLAVFVSSDNFIVGFSYGIKKIKLSILSYLMIILLPTLATVTAMIIGETALYFISTKTANMTGSLILIFLGLAAIIKSKKDQMKERRVTKNYENIINNPEVADVDNSGTIDVKEAVVLSVALAINNIGIGIGASVIGVNLWFTTFFTLFIGALVLSLGNFLGSKIKNKQLGKNGEVISAFLIIFLGIYELFI